jgi:hypothetical protein
MYTVKIASIEEFRESKYLWNDLVLQMKFPCIFCTWEWIYTWWEHFGKAYDLFIMFVYEESSLKGILPLAAQRMVLRNGYMTGSVLSYCGARELYPDHLDIICSEEDANFSLTAILYFLKTHTHEWDLMYIPYVSEESKLLSFFGEGNLAFTSNIKNISVAPYVNISGCFEDYIKSLKKKHKENLRNRIKKLYSEHIIKYESCDPSQYSDGLNTLFDLHKRRASKKKIKSSLDNSKIMEFHHVLLDRISRNGWVSISFLKKEDQVIAASYNYNFGKTVFSYQKGIDPSWEKVGPGSVLLYELIKDAFSRNDKEYNFLQGSEDYKYQWTNEARQLFQLTVYNKTISGIISKAAFDVKSAIKKYLKNKYVKQDA